MLTLPPLVLMLVALNLTGGIFWNYFIKFSQGFSLSQPVATFICATCALTGTITFAKILHTGVNLSILMPIMAALGGLIAIGVGVFVYGESASVPKLALLGTAIGLTILASKF